MHQQPPCLVASVSKSERVRTLSSRTEYSSRLMTGRSYAASRNEGFLAAAHVSIETMGVPILANWRNEAVTRRRSNHTPSERNHLQVSRKWMITAKKRVEISPAVEGPGAAVFTAEAI